MSGQLNHVKENNMIKRTVKEIAEFFGVYKEGDVVKPTSDTDNYIEKESKYHYAREVVFTLRACHAISVEVYLHCMDKINDEEIKEI